MTLDLDRIEQRIAFMRKNLALLETLRRHSESEFVTDQRNSYAAAHALQISIEAMLDVLLHVVVRQRLGAPGDDYETLELAREKGLISKDHYLRFLQMNRFRNKLVHGYLEVDAKTVYRVLEHDLADFELFFDDIRRILEKGQAKKDDSKQGRSRTSKSF